MTKCSFAISNVDPYREIKIIKFQRNLDSHDALSLSTRRKSHEGGLSSFKRCDLRDHQQPLRPPSHLLLS